MEKKLSDFVKRLQSAAGANLKSVVLYGSAVTGEFQAAHSDLNVLCLVERAGVPQLEDVRPALAWWARQGFPRPMIFTREELDRSADVFAIELLDIRRHHRVLFGEDPFEKFEVPLGLHRLQVERELRTNWLRLRQAILTVPPRRSALIRLMTATLSSFVALFRHALIALGDPPAESKREAVARVAVLAGANPKAFETILDLREGKLKEHKVDLEATLQGYLELVELVTDEVGRRLRADRR